jgi:hypothetical protein
MPSFARFRRGRGTENAFGHISRSCEKHASGRDGNRKANSEHSPAGQTSPASLN